MKISPMAGIGGSWSRFGCSPVLDESECPVTLARLSSVFLRVPETEALRLLAKNARYTQRLDQRRFTPQQPDRIKRYCSGFQCELIKDYQDLLRIDPRSRVLCSFHLGDYVYGLNYLSSFEEEDRRCVVLSQQQAPESYFNNINLAFGENSVSRNRELLVESATVSYLSQLLRRKKLTLFTFCDLPPQYSESVSVPFLGRMASFSRGPATLALVSRVPILPVINLSGGKFNRIELGAQIEPVIRQGESFSRAVIRITTELVQMFENYFRYSPEQWRYLPLLASYFCVEGRGEDAGDGEAKSKGKDMT